MIPQEIRGKLSTVSRLGERVDPVVFVGRQLELADLSGLVGNAAGKQSLPLRTMFRLLHGAPGSGKTSLCAEFIRRVNAQESNAPMVAVRVSTAALSQTPLNLTRYIGEQVAEVGRVRRGRRRVFDKALDKLRGFHQAAQKKLLRSDGWDGLKEQRHGLTDDSDLNACLSACAQHVWAPGVTLAVCIDEVQRCEADDKHVKRNMQALYDGEHGGRVVLCCFGLADSAAKFGDMEISRIDRKSRIRIGSLLSGEGRQAIAESLSSLGLSCKNGEWVAHVKSLGMTVRDWGEWRMKLVDALADASDDFPQHLSAGVGAACKAILNADDAGRPLDDAVLDEALALHTSSRHGYYSDRLSHKDVMHHRAALGAACALFAKRREHGDAVVRRDEVLALLSVGDDLGRKPSEDQCDATLRRALDKGVLEEWLDADADDALEHLAPPPVPSMESCLVRGFESRLKDERQVALDLKKVLDDLPEAMSAPRPPLSAPPAEAQGAPLSR